jgi:DNA recombination protein RmuC
VTVPFNYATNIHQITEEIYMNNLAPVLIFAAGAVFGILLTLVIAHFRVNSREKELAVMTETMKGAFAQLSMDSMTKNSENFIQLAGNIFDSKSADSAKHLQAKKELIDAQLANMQQELQRVQILMTGMEKEREARFAEIAEQIKNTVRQTERLSDVTSSLNKALSSTAERGRWGERMALDIIRAAGMKERINYDTQKTMKNGSRPDFTFYLPKSYIVNMDVKFPLDSYQKFCEGQASEQDSHAKNFIRDVRLKIKEVSSRGYIDTQENTLDVVLLFIPNESVYEFIYEKDPAVMDIALQNNVVLTSPLSLYSVLSVIRQAVENFAFESTSGEMLKLFDRFAKQWEMFTGKLETMGKKLDEAQKAYDELVSTRKNMLEKPLEKINALRTEKEFEEV